LGVSKGDKFIDLFSFKGLNKAFSPKLSFLEYAFAGDYLSAGELMNAFSCNS
jgi:hypothetical protein